MTIRFPKHVIAAIILLLVVIGFIGSFATGNTLAKGLIGLFWLALIVSGVILAVFGLVKLAKYAQRQGWKFQLPAGTAATTGSPVVMKAGPPLFVLIPLVVLACITSYMQLQLLWDGRPLQLKWPLILWGIVVFLFWARWDAKPQTSPTWSKIQAAILTTAAVVMTLMLWSHFVRPDLHLFDPKGNRVEEGRFLAASYSPVDSAATTIKDGGPNEATPDEVVSRRLPNGGYEFIVPATFLTWTLPLPLEPNHQFDVTVPDSIVYLHGLPFSLGGKIQYGRRWSMEYEPTHTNLRPYFPSTKHPINGLLVENRGLQYLGTGGFVQNKAPWIIPGQTRQVNLIINLPAQQPGLSGKYVVHVRDIPLGKGKRT